MSDTQQGPNWWQASDGKWYPPNDRPAPGWWQASDGKWYPPESQPPPPPPGPDVTPQGIAARKKQQDANKGVGCMVVIVLIVAAIVFGVLAGGGDDDADSGGSGDGDVMNATAFDMCKQFIGRQVAGSLTYPDYWDHDGEVTVTSQGDRYTVRSHVTGANAFGGPVERQFTCVVRSLPDDEWRLVDLTGLRIS